MLADITSLDLITLQCNIMDKLEFNLFTKWNKHSKSFHNNSFFVGMFDVVVLLYACTV